MEQAKQNRWYSSQFDRRESDSLEQPVGKYDLVVGDQRHGVDMADYLRATVSH